LKQGAGDRIDDIEINAWLSVGMVTDDTESMAAMVAELFSADPKDVLASPLALIGSIDECVDRLQERRERWGYSYHVIPAEQARSFAPLVERLTGT